MLMVDGFEIRLKLDGISPLELSPSIPWRGCRFTATVLSSYRLGPIYHIEDVVGKQETSEFPACRQLLS